MKLLLTHCIYDYAIKVMFNTVIDNFKSPEAQKLYIKQKFKQLITYKIMKLYDRDYKIKQQFFNVEVADVNPDCIYIVLVTNLDTYKSTKHFGGFISVFIDEIIGTNE